MSFLTSKKNLKISLLKINFYNINNWFFIILEYIKFFGLINYN